MITTTISIETYGFNVLPNYQPVSFNKPTLIRYDPISRNWLITAGLGLTQATWRPIKILSNLYFWFSF